MVAVDDHVGVAALAPQGLQSGEFASARPSAASDGDPERIENVCFGRRDSLRRQVAPVAGGDVFAERDDCVH